MKNSMLVAAIVACALSAPLVSAQEKSAPAKPAMGMNMEKQMPQMQEKMKAMQQQMDQIHKTTDAKERQRLMQEHMQAMQENIKTMRSMGGPMMTGGATMDDRKNMAGGAMMEKRMDMMQMMMEQMLQHDHAMESMPAK